MLRTRRATGVMLGAIIFGTVFIGGMAIAYAFGWLDDR